MWWEIIFNFRKKHLPNCDKYIKKKNKNKKGDVFLCFLCFALIYKLYIKHDFREMLQYRGVLKM